MWLKAVGAELRARSLVVSNGQRGKWTAVGAELWPQSQVGSTAGGGSEPAAGKFL